jgi:hypothetical protein
LKFCVTPEACFRGDLFWAGFCCGLSDADIEERPLVGTVNGAVPLLG